MKFFNITKVNCQWLSSDDKQLYYLQVESKGEVGYSTSQVANEKTIHFLKRRTLPAESA